MIVNERLIAYINSLEQEKPDIIKDIENHALKDKVPIIKPETQSLLRFLIMFGKPKSILEIGTAVGFSSIFMSEYMAKDCHITTIEKVSKRIIRAKENIKLANKENRITLLEGDALDLLKDIDKQSDFIFMDAAKGQYINFFSEVIRLLKSGGILISDNVLQEGDVYESRYAITRRNRTIHSRMREYLWIIKHHEELDTVVLPIGDGVALSTKL